MTCSVPKFWQTFESIGEKVFWRRNFPVILRNLALFPRLHWNLHFRGIPLFYSRKSALSWDSVWPISWKYLIDSSKEYLKILDGKENYCLYRKQKMSKSHAGGQGLPRCLWPLVRSSQEPVFRVILKAT
jgi:hypothetical protein